ncbi:hypothetical protein [Nannocystis sp. SCPEA4]|uniref:esterase/lipase family protein n=1 Tax=Nannocystis sp. SCPEA4 TaxID=2996787 RepID=UPI002271E80F|nr:hypothetical protein [Nannocystis sp. SCPEA4]MCY1059403.1 hypothetical protein [Nannocystis sp. SCPEA4]
MHHVFLIPGMFGFESLSQHDYFVHVRTALAERFAAAGVPLTTHHSPTMPTGSICSNAATVLAAVAGLPAESGQRVHLLGHSAGGLVARMAASPSGRLPGDVDATFAAARERLESVVTINSPHYGTPLAATFTTVSGTRLLYVLALLSAGKLSLASRFTAAAHIVMALGDLGRALGLEGRLCLAASPGLARRLADGELARTTAFLQGIGRDQGGIVQIMPEPACVFNAAAEDSPAIRYGCFATASPRPSLRRLMHGAGAQGRVLSRIAYGKTYYLTCRPARAYPYARPDATTTARLSAALGATTDDSSNDGIVPTHSMLWGDLIWCGPGDHHDVLGHFRDDEAPARHVDWLDSGAAMTRRRFGEAMDSLASYLMA